MNQRLTIIGGSLMALLMSSTVSLAQNYPGSYSQQGGNQGDYRDQRFQQQRGYNEPYTRTIIVPMPQARVKSPVDLLEQSINKVIKFLSQPGQASLEQMTFFLNKEIAPHFDFDYMSRYVAGRYYKVMSPEQQQQFNKTFTELFITTFVQKMSNYQNYPPVVGDFISRRTRDNEAMASAKIYQESGANIQADFKFLKSPRGWKVVDVRANGVSALLYYRNYFTQQIRRRDQHQAVFN